MDDAGNADEVRRWLERFVMSFNFTRPGVDRNMGRDLAHLVAGKIAERSAKGLAPDGTKWKRNSDRPNPRRGTLAVPGFANIGTARTGGYLTEKRKRYGWPESDGKPNYRTGQMLSHLSLFGDTVVGPDTVEMHYGIDVPPDRTYSPVDNRTASQVRADEAVTDREKAGYAVENDRPFYELDDDIRDAVLEEAERLLSDYIAKEG